MCMAAGCKGKQAGQVFYVSPYFIFPFFVGLINIENSLKVSSPLGNYCLSSLRPNTKASPSPLALPCFLKSMKPDT